MANTLTNYAAYIDPITKTSRIGHMDLGTSTITPLSFRSGAPLTDLYQVITAGEANIATYPGQDTRPLSSVKLLPPISGRDILAVGKNYSEHAREFNTSGFDASDKNDQPTHPVIFTKRATSIIGHEDPILLHPEFTSTPDYEGEIGVIVGKPGFRISEEQAMEHIWGYTIINDMTARERQRDHKQFFLGKSPDTFCPMGPIAVPKEALPEDLIVRTHVNGEKRQEASIRELIFSIPTLIASISAGQTLQAGDVLATGTPYGVGFGFRPMKFLQPGDEVCVSVTGLGTLKNPISSLDAVNYTTESVKNDQSVIPVSNTKAPAGSGLHRINRKDLFYQHVGNKDGPPVIFIHGLGASSTYYTPLIPKLEQSHSLHLLDLEGHGLSSTSALNELTIASYAEDIHQTLQFASITTPVTIIAHSMGCLIAAHLALHHPEQVSKLILLGPPPSPLPEPASQAMYARASLVREKGMLAVVDAIIQAGLSAQVRANNPLAVTAVRMSLLGQNAEGYAKGCMAMAASAGETLDFSKVNCSVVIITGEEDRVGSVEVCERYAGQVEDGRVDVLKGVGHWHLLEDVQGCLEAVLSAL